METIEFYEFLAAAIQDDGVLLAALVGGGIWIRGKFQHIDSQFRGLKDSLREHESQNEKDFGDLRSDVGKVHERVDKILHNKQE